MNAFELLLLAIGGRRGLDHGYDIVIVEILVCKDEDLTSRFLGTIFVLGLVYAAAVIVVLLLLFESSLLFLLLACEALGAIVAVFIETWYVL